MIKIAKNINVWLKSMRKNHNICKMLIENIVIIVLKSSYWQFLELKNTMYEVLYFEENILKIVKLKELLIKSWSLTENSLYYKYPIQKRETGEIQYGSICCWWFFERNQIEKRVYTGRGQLRNLYTCVFVENWKWSTKTGTTYFGETVWTIGYGE